MVLALSLPAGQVQAAGNTYVADEDGSQIGRASCRERV